MKVSQLINELSSFPQDLDCYMLYDGALRSSIEFVYISNSNNVGFADSGDVIYYDECRPQGSPSKEEEQFFKTP